MSPLKHRIYITTLSSIVVIVAVVLFFRGFVYYSTSLEERFYHPDHGLLKPSGLVGHGLGIVGTLLIFIGVFMYIVRKRWRVMARWGRLKHWLEFHIFLCILGPVMVLFHTSFKFGGIVSVAFWSMVAVVASGVIGRFLYIRIPKSVEGRELSLHELRQMKGNLERMIGSSYGLSDEECKKLLSLPQRMAEVHGSNFIQKAIRSYFTERIILKEAKETLDNSNMPKASVKKVVGMLKREIAFDQQIENLHTMQKLFRYWHVVHLPFALIMLVIVIIHVIVTVAMGSHWIF